MKDWNVVVTVHEGGYKRGWMLLEKLGSIGKTNYDNVLSMKVEDISVFLTTLAQWVREEPDLLHSVFSRAMPAEISFYFQSSDEFESRARAIALKWIPVLIGRSFHVRMHCRGFKGRLSIPKEEQFLEESLLEALGKTGIPGFISFEDPDAILVIETVSNWAGMSLWTRDDLQRYPFLKLN